MLHSLSGQNIVESARARLLSSEGILSGVVKGGAATGPGLFENADHGPDMVLESLVGETHHACARTVVIASWTNALDNPETAVSAATVRAFIPDDPAIMVTMARWIKATTLDGESLHRTKEFFASLAVARKSFDLFMGEAGQIGFVRAGILHRRVLSGSWRFAIDRALDALLAQAGETALSLPDVYRENARALEALIGEVRSGGSPSLNMDGTIRLPELPNQRRSTRRFLLENCLVKTGRKTFSAFARDVSMGGLGLDRVPQLSPGARVTIQLPTGRSFAGCVRWYKNASAGVSFDVPLAPNDALLKV